MSSRRATRRASARLGVTAAALTAVLGLSPAAAHAHDGSAGVSSLLVDCVTVNPDGSYIPVFGYTNNSGQTGTIPVGSYNTVTPATYNGQQTTTFTAGTHHGAWSTKTAVPAKTKVTWTVAGVATTASATSRRCSSDVQLPADGNGTGTALILLASVPLAGAAAWVARRRRRGDA